MDLHKYIETGFDKNAAFLQALGDLLSSTVLQVGVQQGDEKSKKLLYELSYLYCTQPSPFSGLCS